MLRRLTCCLGFLAALACVMGADSVTMTSSVPNPPPNNPANTAAGKGKYAVDPAHVLVSLDYVAALTKTAQTTKYPATRDVPNPGDWNGQLLLAPATYDTYPKLVTWVRGTMNPAVYNFSSTLQPTQITVK